MSTEQLTAKQRTIWNQHNEGTSAYRIAIATGMKPAEVFQQIQQIKKLLEPKK